MSADDLIDELWGERPPRTAEKTLGSHVSKLRGALETGRGTGSSSGVLATQGGGYVLEPRACEIDAIRFEELAIEGRDLLAEGRADAASKILAEALGLWRGAAYQGLRSTSFGAAEGERLEELRRTAVEDRVEAELDLGTDGTLVAQPEGMVREEPLRERRWGQLMLSLYRAGRQAEALDAYRRAREDLVNELGVEPGPALQEMQAAILRQDPALDRTTDLAMPRPDRMTVQPNDDLARVEASDTTAMRIVIADDAVLIREGIARLLQDAGFDVVDQVGDAQKLMHDPGSGRASIHRMAVASPRADRVGRIAQVTVWSAAFGFGLFTLAVARSEPGGSFGGASWAAALAELVAGWALIGAGLYLSLRRPRGRSGYLLAAAGVAWFFVEWNNPGDRVLGGIHVRPRVVGAGRADGGTRRLDLPIRPIAAGPGSGRRRRRIRGGRPLAGASSCPVLRPPATGLQPLPCQPRRDTE